MLYKSKPHMRAFMYSHIYNDEDLIKKKEINKKTVSRPVIIEHVWSNESTRNKLLGKQERLFMTQ